MGLLDGLLGGAVGAEMVTVVNGLIEKHGGVQGIVAQLEQQGLGNTVRSWVGTGANQPISADQIHQAFGSDTVKQLAAKIGMTHRGPGLQAVADSASGNRQTHSERRCRENLTSAAPQQESSTGKDVSAETRTVERPTGRSSAGPAARLRPPAARRRRP